LGFYQFLIDVSRQPIGPIYRDQAGQEDCLTPEDGKDGLSRNVDKKLSFYAADNLNIAQTSFTPRRKSEIKQGN